MILPELKPPTVGRSSAAPLVTAVPPLDPLLFRTGCPVSIRQWRHTARARMLVPPRDQLRKLSFLMCKGRVITGPTTQGCRED